MDVEPAAKHRQALLSHPHDVSFVYSSMAWDVQHHENCRRWKIRVDTERSNCIFIKHRAFVRRHLGIDVWVSNVRLPSLQAVTQQADEWKLNRPQNATVAYTTLPNKVSSRQEWTVMSDLYGHLQSGHTMPANFGAVPTEASLRRFPRALKLLGLKVFIHPTQKEPVRSTPTNVQSSDDTNTADESTTSWPQLTILTKCRAEG